MVGLLGDSIQSCVCRSRLERDLIGYFKCVDCVRGYQTRVIERTTTYAFVCVRYLLAPIAKTCDVLDACCASIQERRRHDGP
jgi:hypothetical protein